jgi:hypothetical protein
VGLRTTNKKPTSNIQHPTSNNYVRFVRDVLSGIYKGNEQKLGDWGFEVDQSAKSSAAPAPAPATAGK